VFEFDFPATGTLTAVAANPVGGVVVGQQLVISDGPITKTFEFTLSPYVGLNVPIYLNTATDSVALVKGAIMVAVNSAGLNITAQSGIGNAINLINGAFGAGNVLITETLAGGATLNPTGMSGAGVLLGNTAVLIRPNFSAGQVKNAIITAINASAVEISVVTGPGAGTGDVINLINDNWGTAGNIAITESLVNAPNSVTLWPTGMSGGFVNADATAIKAAIISAISGAGLNISAASGIGDSIVLTNTLNLTAGNVTITESLANGTLTPTGMSGGLDDPNALTIKAAMISAINGAAFGVTASDAGSANIRLSNSIVGTAGNIPIGESIASGATLQPVGMDGGLIATGGSDRAMAVRSVDFGSPSKLRVSLRLPTEAGVTDISVTHTNDFMDGAARCNLIVVLASGALVAGSLLNTGVYSTNIVPNGNLYLLTIIAPLLNPLGQYQPGRILNIGGTGDISGSYLIVSAAPGSVTALMPGHGGKSGLSAFNASLNPLSCFPLAVKTWVDVGEAITAYLPANPIAKVQPYGTAFVANPVALPTYVSHTAPTPYTESSISGAFIHHSFDCKMAGSAGIWQYDSSVLGLNNIKATGQTDDSIFPTVTEALGTTYLPIGEEVMIIPTNSKTMTAWLNFNAASSFTILGEAQRISSSKYIQLSSRQDGSLGGVRITGVTGNTLESFVIGNGTNEEFSSKIRVLSTDAKSMVRNNIVKVQNSVTSELLRPYRAVPSGTAITIYNQTGINTFFRQANSIKYIRTGANTARFVFYRFGQYFGQAEPLTVLGAITLSSVGSGRVQVFSADGDLAARVGDMMYVRPDSNFPADVKCKGLTATGITTGTVVEYWGYPVTKVIDNKTIEIVAPNITSFGTTNISSTTDLVFLPAIYNEKNVKSNKNWGSHFESIVNSGNMSYLVKHLGGGVMSLWVQNSATEATDNAGLADLLVNTDDLITIGDGFSSANKGTFKVIGHNGRNHVIFFNESGGFDEIIDTTTFSEGGNGSRKWTVGPINTPTSRPIRIIDGESVRLGDRLRISTPVTTSQWFPAELYGSWQIIGTGYIGIVQATGSLTAVAAALGTGIEDGDKFTISDGDNTLTFEFDTNGSWTVGNIRVMINAADPATAVQTAIIAAINGLGANFAITASPGVGIGEIALLNRRVNAQTAITITQSMLHSPAVTLTPVGMTAILADNGQLCPYVDVEFPNAINEIFDDNTGLPINKMLIGGNDSAIGFVEGTAFSGYRMVGGFAVNPLVAEECELFLVPRLQTSKMSDSFGTRVTAMAKLGYEERTFQGIDGYKVFSGLIRQAHRVIDGLPTNTILYPGNKAMGTVAEVLPPLIRTIQIALQVRPKDGVTINSISEIIKSKVASYVNGLDVGKPVVLSEIVRLVQGLPGVYSVAITGTIPVVTDDRIVVSDIERALVLNASTDITVG
jgi:hypothetical protein